ncbi:type I-B CRISPR-associated protein Cas7/Csh2 [Thermosipho ferrireducens]|uniref:Type I-B CRISPR-associated protein Cas7/Csh2 n=1 Tax=Thermosipho ferrireducens TaxID=2571116 RepID=A0ABX7S5T6_9BACT|nr:type I-B CRISPR-associated protein Cas7/Csh2 [Thermosipho ferrireducens]QTA37933.1 type I-B CRISPR-associated protein Cas7/Csh2 [Thermosipho ferrireducens]
MENQGLFAENLFSKNSDILFIYDAHLSNPNGDPDDENRPRFDYDTSRNLVSDVRLKRYIRDYLQNKGYEIFVTKIDNKTVDSTGRIKKLTEKLGKNEVAKITEEDILNSFIDVRLFGATITLKSNNSSKGSSYTFTGPVQFTWGYSLHRAQLLESSGITSMFAGRTEGGKGEHGTMGKDWRVKYSLIGFYGLISGWRAKHTKLTYSDVEKLDEAVIKSLKLLTSTRSKVGQTPRFYLRIQYKDAETLFGDLRDLVITEEKGEHLPAKPGDVELSFEPLIDYIYQNKETIEKIVYWQDANATFIKENFAEVLKEKLGSDGKLCELNI